MTSSIFRPSVWMKKNSPKNLSTLCMRGKPICVKIMNQWLCRYYTHTKNQLNLHFTKMFLCDLLRLKLGTNLHTDWNLQNWKNYLRLFPPADTDYLSLTVRKEHKPYDWVITQTTHWTTAQYDLSSGGWWVHKHHKKDADYHVFLYQNKHGGSQLLILFISWILYDLYAICTEKAKKRVCVRVWMERFW